MIRLGFLAVALALGLSAAGCGLKGDLYLPPPETSPEQAKNAP